MRGVSRCPFSGRTPAGLHARLIGLIDLRDDVTGRHVGAQTDRQTDRQTDGQTATKYYVIDKSYHVTADVRE